MKTTIRLLLAATMACALAACHTPETAMATGNGAILLYGDTVTLRVIDAPKATIGVDGVFAIDGEAVIVTPAERKLLIDYHRSVRSVHDTGVAMGKTGVEMATDAVKGKLSSTPNQADKAIEAGASNMKDLSLDICKAETAIKDAQDQLAAQLVAFKPYAAIISASDVTDCENNTKD
jgi:hypothetical protein